MIHKIALELAIPNPAKGNTAYDLTHLEKAADAAGFLIAERSLLVFESGGWGGNHKHERQELVAAVSGNPTFIYRDQGGNRVEEPMGPNEDGLYTAFLTSSWDPHLVENRGDQPAVIYELRDRFSINYANLVGPESLR